METARERVGIKKDEGGNWSGGKEVETSREGGGFLPVPRS